MDEVDGVRLREEYDEAREGEDGARERFMADAAAYAGGSLPALTWPGTMPPQWVIDFAASLAPGRAPGRLIDPAAGIGGFIGPLSAMLPDLDAMGVCPDEAACRLAAILHPGRVAWEKETGPAALLVCAVADGGAGEAALEAVEKTVSRVDADGAVMLLLAPGRSSGEGLGRITGMLESGGLVLRAAVGLGWGLFVFAVRGARGPALFADLSDEAASPSLVAKNILLSREGLMPAAGVLAPPGRLPVWREVLLEREVMLDAGQAGLPPIPLPEVAQVGCGGSPEPEEGALWFPPDLSATASTLPDGAGKDWCCAVPDPERIVPGYLGWFFAAPAGRKALALAACRVRREGTCAALNGAPVWAPPLDVQEEILEAEGLLAAAEERLETLRKTLRSHPHAAGRVLAALEAFPAGGGAESWLETLPFPLASILWAYRAGGSPGEKNAYLMDFFEALAEFLATVMASALLPLVSEGRIDLAGNDREFGELFSHSSFRGWTLLCRRLGGHTRSLAASPEGRRMVMRRYGNPPREFLMALTGKRLYAVLDEVADYRNLWKGHGTQVSDREEEERCARLENCLLRASRLIGSAFEPALLMRPGGGEYHDGTFSYTVEALYGSHTPFRRITVETAVPLDTGRLYLIFEGQLRPLELLPFIRLEEIGEGAVPACYFYNRMDDDQVRFISYHFIGQPELIVRDPGVADALRALGLFEE